MIPFVDESGHTLHNNHGEKNYTQPTHTKPLVHPQGRRYGHGRIGPRNDYYKVETKSTTDGRRRGGYIFHVEDPRPCRKPRRLVPLYPARDVGRAVFRHGGGGRRGQEAYLALSLRLYLDSAPGSGWSRPAPVLHLPLFRWTVWTT